MSYLAEPHEPVHDCDCQACACHERDRLRAALKRANEQAEHFEREWYLRGDTISELRTFVTEVAIGAYQSLEFKEMARNLLKLTQPVADVSL